MKAHTCCLCKLRFHPFEMKGNILLMSKFKLPNFIPKRESLSHFFVHIITAINIKIVKKMTLPYLTNKTTEPLKKK